MAQRRMFSLKIVDTDKFLEMPPTARLLYYDLAMRADDDGFVNSPKKIIQMVGASTDDFKILCAKEYIIPFDSGVVVIKDWRVHNLIRHDRYTETEYVHEKQQLAISSNKYVIPDGNQPAPQVRLGKVRLGKDSINRAKPSSPKEVQDYLDELGCKLFTGQQFWDKNESIGWVVGKNKSPVKDWRAVVRTWISHAKGDQKEDTHSRVDRIAKSLGM